MFFAKMDVYVWTKVTIQDQHQNINTHSPIQWCNANLTACVCCVEEEVASTRSERVIHKTWSSKNKIRFYHDDFLIWATALVVYVNSCYLLFDMFCVQMIHWLWGVNFLVRKRDRTQKLKFCIWLFHFPWNTKYIKKYLSVFFVQTMDQRGQWGSMLFGYTFSEEYLLFAFCRKKKVRLSKWSKKFNLGKLWN